MILVTGGTGLTGSHLLLYLTRKGFLPRAIYRDKKSLQKTKNLFINYSAEPNKLFNRIEWIQADITDITGLQPAFDKVKQVYHTAALVSFKPNDKELLHQTNVTGTENILACAQEAGVEKLLHVSSIATLGNYENPITEQTHWNWKEPHSDYAVTKYLSEMEVWRAGQEGLPVVIVKPSIIMGAHFWDTGIGKTIHKSVNGMKFYPPGGNGFVDVWDLVKTMVDLMNSPIENDSFIVSAYDLPYKKFLTEIHNNLDKKAPDKKLPKWLAYFLFLTGKLPKSVYRNFYRHPHYSSEKLKNTLNFKFIPFEASIQNIMTQYKKSNL